jgi:hypothetical protein
MDARAKSGGVVPVDEVLKIGNGAWLHLCLTDNVSISEAILASAQRDNVNYEKAP